MSIRIDSAKAFIATSFGYDFNNNALLMEALDTTGLRQRESNQRLALLGDKILAFLVAEAWYATGEPKGTGQNNIARIGCNASLVGTAQNIGLTEHVMINPAQRTTSDKLLATTLEALLAAIYLDSDNDIDAVKSAMFRLGMDVESF